MICDAIDRRRATKSQPVYVVRKGKKKRKRKRGERKTKSK
jgi:hypothetical protein